MIKKDYRAKKSWGLGIKLEDFQEICVLININNTVLGMTAEQSTNRPQANLFNSIYERFSFSIIYRET